MEFLHRRYKQNIAAEQSNRTQLKGSNMLKVGRYLFNYSMLISVIGIMLIGGTWFFVWQQINYDYVRTIAVSYRILPDYPLIVSVGKSTQVIMADYEQRKQGYILGASLGSLFIVVISILLIRRHNTTKRLTVSIQQEKDRLFALVNSISDEVWFADNEKKITLVNLSGLQEFRLLPEEAEIEKNITSLEILRPDGSLRPIEETPPLRALQGETVIKQQEIVRHTATGQLRYREVTSNPVRDTGGNIIGAVSVVSDITDRKIMEDELEKHRDNLQILVEEQVKKIQVIGIEMTAIFESISDPFCIMDKEWRLKYINEEGVQAGFQLSEKHVGQNVWAAFPEMVGGEIYQKYHEACATNKPIHTLFKSIIDERVFDAHLYPYTDGLIVYLRDVTEQKKYEADLLRLDRLNLIGEMAAGIGHEVRNPMTTVRGYLQWFIQKDTFREHRESFGIMIEELDRANSIITEFLSLAKDKRINLVLTDLNKIIRSIFPLLQADAFLRGNNIELKLQDTLEIFMDEKEIRQCILNLVANGLDAMPDGGKVTITTANLGNQVVMTVRDRGQGMTPEVKAKLWTPFFTTKECGTGLGLPVCYQIAQRHKATIEVETSPHGTAFHFIFNQTRIEM